MKMVEFPFPVMNAIEPPSTFTHFSLSKCPKAAILILCYNSLAMVFRNISSRRLARNKHQTPQHGRVF